MKTSNNGNKYAATDNSDNKLLQLP